jgi:predicted outer membrane repeat protein
MFNDLDSNAALTDVTFSLNSAERGGGIWNNRNSDTILTNVTFNGNMASTYGGAMTIAGDSSNPILTNVTFNGNIANYGGAISSVYGVSATLKNVTVAGNTARIRGGGLYNFDNSNLTLYNSVVYGNSGGQVFNVNSMPVITYSIIQGGYSGQGNQDVDPLLGVLHDNGGYTHTMALATSSPAVNGGKDANCAGSDQRGVIRPQGIHCDIGSYELDNLPPENTTTTVLSIVRANASPTSSSSVDFTVTFSADVTGLDIGDFTLTAPEVSNPAITNVSGSGNIYTVTVDTGAGNGTIRLDIPSDADIVDSYGNPPINLSFTGGALYSIIKVGTFDDVPNSYWAWRWVEGFYHEKITTGCTQTPLLYCPERQVTRAEMAVFLLRAKYTSTYQPNPAQTGMFADVPVPGKEWMKPWIEQFYLDGITTGCAQSPLRYCPERQVTRAEMAVFILRAKYGANHQPNPVQTGMFADVPVPGKEWMQPWIEEFYEQGITTGCAQSPLQYCPERPVTRAEMAVFIDRAFGIAPLP